ncbi:MAG TPA: hypothetical protein VEF03_11685 [Candidatus Binataceae bacterium]|nr:hypothetical protein [Candidatus Binataceae bacterium]
MALSDAQIERYSRQIIVPALSGRAQERLLAASMLIVGDVADIAMPTAYLVGAGVGAIRIAAEVEDSALEKLIARMRALNSDCKIESSSHESNSDFVFATVGSTRALETANSVSRPASTVLVRLDTPAKIAIIRKSPPCIRCADANLLAPFGVRVENSEFVAMAATVEALKLLAKIDSDASHSALAEFRGYQSTSRLLKRAPGARGCACPNA